MTWRVLTGDCLAVLPTLEAKSAHCCVTSPPYWGLRDYGHAEQLGAERTPSEYVERMVAVFREVRRVLRDDGTLWLNLGDTYASTGGHADTACNDRRGAYNIGNRPEHNRREFRAGPSGDIKAKDLVGIPWMVALALRADGWWLRSDVIWSKPNPMPDSVTDRPTKAHEYLFLLSKSARYYYDSAAIAEPAVTERSGNKARRYHRNGEHGRVAGHVSNQATSVPWEGETRNRRSVWTIATQPYDGAHFATMPPALAEPCIRAGSPNGGGLVLDPFSGAGTTGMVACRLGRSFVGIELNPAYVEMSQRRILADAPLLNAVTAVAQ